MKPESELGQRIEELALSYAETQKLIGQTPAEEIKYLLTKYAEITQQLRQEGISPSHQNFELLEEKIMERVQQLLPEVHDEEQLKSAALVARNPSAMIPGTRFTRPWPDIENLSTYRPEDWGEKILERMILEIDGNLEKMAVAKGKRTLNHEALKSKVGNDCYNIKLISTDSIISTETNEVLSEAAMYDNYGKKLIILYVSEYKEFADAAKTIIEKLPIHGTRLHSKSWEFYPKQETQRWIPPPR